VNERKIDLIAIDNLPTLVPKESSQYFSNKLLKHLQDLLGNVDPDNIWRRSKDIFLQQLAFL
ncbi:MAG: saccharopine dehydrogenase, partial [Bdellovibrionota bacterium]